MRFVRLINRDHLGPVGMNGQFYLRFGTEADERAFAANRLQNAFAKHLLKIPKLKQGRKNKFDLCHALQPFSFFGEGSVKNFRPG